MKMTEVNIGMFGNSGRSGFGLRMAIVGALSAMSLGAVNVADKPALNTVEMRQPSRSRRVTRTRCGKVSPIYRQRDSRKTISVPQMKRAAKKRRNMAKRGQR